MKEPLSLQLFRAKSCEVKDYAYIRLTVLDELTVKPLNHVCLTLRRPSVVFKFGAINSPSRDVDSQQRS